MEFRLVAMQEAIGKIAAKDLTERDIDLYVKKRLAAGRKPATLTAEMTYLKQAFKLAERKKLIERIPHIQRFKLNNARQGFFEQDDIERVISFLPNWLSHRAKIKPVFNLVVGERDSSTWVRTYQTRSACFA